MEYHKIKGKDIDLGVMCLKSIKYYNCKKEKVKFKYVFSSYKYIIFFLFRPCIFFLYKYTTFCFWSLLFCFGPAKFNCIEIDPKNI